MSRALPFVVAFGLIGVLQFLVYLLLGAAPFSALVGGVASGLVALLGAAAFELTRRTQVRRAVAAWDEQDIDEAVTWLRDAHEHEGLHRLHEDMRREEQRGEPPER